MAKQQALSSGGFHVRGVQYLKHEVFSCEHRRHETQVARSQDRVVGGILKKICNLVQSRAHFSVHKFAIFDVIFLKKKYCRCRHDSKKNH